MRQPRMADAQDGSAIVGACAVAPARVRDRQAPAEGGAAGAVLPTARREWDRLDDRLRETFGKLLKKRLETPRIGQSLKGRPNHYKIKLREAGYRLVYEVEDAELVVLVVAIGRRASEVNDRAARR